MRPGEVWTVIFSIRMSADERALIEAAAERAGVAASDWAREALLRAL